LSVNARLSVTAPLWRLNIFDAFGHPVDMYNLVKQRPYWATLFDGWNVNSLDFTTNPMVYYRYHKSTCDEWRKST
jgi:hypothetical protein